MQVKPAQNAQSALWKRDGPNKTFSSSLGGKRYERIEKNPGAQCLKCVENSPTSRLEDF